MRMDFSRQSCGVYRTIDNRFLIRRDGNRWDITIRDGKDSAPYRDGFKSLRSAKEYLLNTWYCMHVNL